MSFASDFTQFSEFRHISQHSARNLCKMADLAIFSTRICDGTLCRRAGCPHPAAQGKRIPTPVTAGHTGPALQGATVIQGGQSRPPLQSRTRTVQIRQSTPAALPQGCFSLYSVEHALEVNGDLEGSGRGFLDLIDSELGVDLGHQ